MSGASHQTLRVLDGLYVLERPADVTEVMARGDVLAVVFGPDGSTVMRRDDTGQEAWSALWNGDAAHDVQATGMLSAIVAPLAAGGLPVWVASAYDGDLVLVPADRVDEAAGVLEAAGHQVRRTPA
ncbi:MAG TPA: ACT domain-containing protein [Streptosporangiaceae bacterium]|nr:ACT domain-containing protein [Streptosporangiaceae bacterium]